MHAREWIEKNAKFQRTISLEYLRKQLKRERGHCTWCDKKTTGRWCSAKCKNEGYVRNGMDLAALVERRDRGVCCLCGLDCLALQKRIYKLHYRAKEKRLCYSFSRVAKLCKKIEIYPHGRPYDIDHIIPVIEGGGCCGLDNLRTLCRKCHKEVTAAMAGKRAKNV